MHVDNKFWETFSDEKWQHLVEQYLLEISSNAGKEYTPENNKWGLIVTEFRFSSRPELQWKFILLAISLATTDRQLGDIAAGQIEHLLGWHGEEYIDIIEQEAEANPKIAKALTGVLKYMMSDQVWARVQKLQRQAEHKI